MRTTDLSRDEARRTALAAQGFADRGPSGRVDIRHLRRVLARINVLQIDTVNVLVRSHYLPLFSRLGPYPMSLLDEAIYARRELFETWAHVACMLPMEHYPLLRYRMGRYTAESSDEFKRFHHWARWAKANGSYVDRVLDEVRERGPLAVRELDDPGEKRGVFWMTSEGKMALHWLFLTGRVMVHERTNFARSYDVTERVVPREVLAAAVPAQEEAERTLLLMAARAHGLGTARDLADYYRMPVVRSRGVLEELVAEDALRKVAVEGWREPAYLHPEVKVPRAIDARALLTPFDSLVWERDRTERIFGFRYRIEIYTPEHKREFGYYVLPFLLGDRLAGRIDLKADRAKRTLVARAAHVEAGEEAGAVAEALAEELEAMARWLELDRIVVERRGSLAAALGRAMRPRRR
jgi:uncharacterized protein YcaQ